MSVDSLLNVSVSARLRLQVDGPDSCVPPRSPLMLADSLLITSVSARLRSMLADSFLINLKRSSSRALLMTLVGVHVHQRGRQAE